MLISDEVPLHLFLDGFRLLHKSRLLCTTTSFVLPIVQIKTNIKAVRGLYLPIHKCLRHLKGIKLKYQNMYVYQKVTAALLPTVGIEPWPLVWEEDTLLYELQQVSTLKPLTTEGAPC